MKIFTGFVSLVVVITLGACANLNQRQAPALQDKVETQLKISTGGGRVKAKLVLTNQGSKELIIDDLKAQNFRIETADGQLLNYTGELLSKSEPLRLKPGQSVETAFNLHQSFPFKDRLTRYKIRFESSQIRSQDAQVWY